MSTTLKTVHAENLSNEIKTIGHHFFLIPKIMIIIISKNKELGKGVTVTKRSIRQRTAVKKLEDFDSLVSICTKTLSADTKCTITRNSLHASHDIPWLYLPGCIKQKLSLISQRHLRSLWCS